MIKFQHTKHKALWDMIITLLHDANQDISSVARLKYEAFNRLYPGESHLPTSICYACEYDEDIIDMFTEENQPEPCENCPLLWPDNKLCDEENNSLYSSFLYACHINDRQKAIKIAEDIRDCPVREGVDVE